MVQYAWFNGVDPKAMREVDDDEVVAGSEAFQLNGEFGSSASVTFGTTCD